MFDKARIMSAVTSIIKAIGEDPEKEGLVDTPRRVAEMYAELFMGLDVDPKEELAVCYELGIDEVYRIGGAQAVAALTVGTRKIRRVDKIVGPGNQWVQSAKKEVFGSVGIDSIAGPSEVLIIANDKANPAWVAADMLSQAEHAPGGAVVFTDSRKLANEVLAELKNQVNQL